MALSFFHPCYGVRCSADDEGGLVPTLPSGPLPLEDGAIEACA